MAPPQRQSPESAWAAASGGGGPRFVPGRGTGNSRSGRKHWGGRL